MASVDEVFEVVKDTQIKVSELVEWKAGMKEACKAHRRETDELKETVYGNPGGLRDKVEKLWNCKSGLVEWKAFWMYVLKIVVATGAVGLIACILQSIFGGG